MACGLVQGQSCQSFHKILFSSVELSEITSTRSTCGPTWRSVMQSGSADWYKRLIGLEDLMVWSQKVVACCRLEKDNLFVWHVLFYHKLRFSRAFSIHTLFLFRSGTDLMSLLILFFLLVDHLKKSLRLCHFKSNQNEIWRECSCYKCAYTISRFRNIGHLDLLDLYLLRGK